ncbi:MAG: C4-dicarboxylate ABC transporter, partial [Rhodospirillaceae bacterium]|nr:C4-dicarboxylate ABC transporter [Rhodospirillaceae bacterium]
MELVEFFAEYLPIFMFLSLACLLFTGYPVAFILGGLAIGFGLIGHELEMFKLIEYFNFMPRIWGMAAENLVLV